MVSIVVPTYNDAHFLPAALASCLNQTIPVEIVLVDDGSTSPMPEEVVRFIADHRDIVTVVRHAWNCGLSASRNSGIAQARHDLILPLDADDWLLPGSLAPLVAAMTDECDIVYGDVVDTGKLYEPVKRPLQRTDFLEDTPLFCSSLFRRTVWKAAGGYTVRPGPHYEDWNFWAKAFKAGCRFRYVPVTVYEHRSRPDSMLRFLHHERPRYVRMAIEPLLEDIAPPPAPAPVSDAASPKPSTTDDVASDLQTRRQLLMAHARIGQLLIEREQQRMQQVRAPRRPDALVHAHARIGRLMIELDQARAQLSARDVTVPVM